MTTHDITDKERAILTTFSADVQARYERAHGYVWGLTEGGDTDVMYGSCPRGSDPRDYSPDLECCSPAEIAAWAEACRLWDDGGTHTEGPMLPNTVCSADYQFGIGVYAFRVPPGWWEPDNGPDWDDDLNPDQGYPALPQDAYVEAWPVRRQR